MGKIMDTLDTVKTGDKITAKFSRAETGAETTVTGEVFVVKGTGSVWVRTGTSTTCLANTSTGWTNADLVSVTL